MRATLAHPVVLTAEDIEHLPTVVLHDIGTGVSHRVLWEQEGSMGGVMRIRADGHVDPHVHQHAFHDIWVLDGTCEVLGHHLTEGSYVHVPAGIEHAIDAGPAGCSLLYLYRR